MYPPIKNTEPSPVPDDWLQFGCEGIMRERDIDPDAFKERTIHVDDDIINLLLSALNNGITMKSHS